MALIHPPRWGDTLIDDVRTMPVEQWLAELKKQDGTAMSREYKQMMRTCLSALFTHAMRAELCGGNPISCGGAGVGKGGSRGSGAGVRILGELTPKRATIHFSPQQTLGIMGELDTRDRCMVLMDSVLGLRRARAGITLGRLRLREQPVLHPTQLQLAHRERRSTEDRELSQATAHAPSTQRCTACLERRNAF